MTTTIIVIAALAVVLGILVRYVGMRKRPYGYPENSDEAITWEKGGLSFTITEVAIGDTHRHYCGYVRFPNRPLREKSYRGIVRFVPVHGGVTYALKDHNGSMVYGFDCAHPGDEENEQYRDIEWVKAETERLGVGIAVAHRYEKELKRVKSKEAKLGIIMAYHLEMQNLGIPFQGEENPLAMLAFMTGDL